MNLPVERAIGTALALSTVTALAGVVGHWRNGNVDRQSALYLALSSVAGVFAGAVLILYLSPNLLKSLMVVTFVLTGLLSLARINRAEQANKMSAARQRVLLLPAGLVTGLVSGAFGLSGSTPLSSFLVAFVYLSPAVAVGTSLTVVLVTSLVGALVYCQRQAIDFDLLLILGVGSVVGAYFGAKLTTYINRRTLAITLAVLALVFGIYMAFHST